MSFHMTIDLNSICDSWLASISVSILSEASSFPFIWGLFLCLPIVCETLLVSLCFLNWSVLTPWVCGVNFSGRRPVRLSGAVSLISWSYWPWALVSVGSVYVFGFWFLLGLSLVGLCHQLVIWGAVPHLLCSVVQVWAGCVGAGFSVCTRFWGFSLALVQLFLLSNFFIM